MTIERVDFTYRIGALVKASAEELENMIKCSRTHYDLKCKAASAEAALDETTRIFSAGGFLTAWKRHVKSCREAKIEDEGFEISSRDLDVLCKILESPGAKPGLYEEIVTVLREVSDRGREILGQPKQKHGIILNPFTAAALGIDPPA